MNEYIVIFCTVPSREEGSRIGGALVRKRLAACVNIVPGLTSIYEWKGEICEDGECLLLIKTGKNIFDSVVTEITALHPYECPEIISLPISDGLKSYLDWISENTVN